MAYAALLSFSQTLEHILIHEQYPLLFKKQKLVSLHRNVGTLLTFLEDYSHKCSGALNPLESEIITAVYHAEDIIESQYSSRCLSKFCIGNIIAFCISICWPEPRRNSVSLQKVLRKIDLILEEVMKIKNSNPAENVSSSPVFSDSPSLSISDMNTMVFEEDFMIIKERIYKKSCNFEVIPIVGMGGIGKSTLARRLYEDSVKERNFDRCIWIVVSQDYSLNKMLSEILLSIGKATPTTRGGYTDGELRQLIYQDLFGRRYLVVVDDLWSEKAWDDLNLTLPKDTIGSRALVTTRLSEVARHVGSSFNPPHEMQLLNEYQSWKLFEESVFGKSTSCPSELEQIGYKVAKSCRGLPLTIVVVSGLLKGNTTKEYWESISENISLAEPTIAQQCSKVLSLSYGHLPLYLKPCFLYVTAFPEDYVIKVSRLISLWIAEGFVKPNGPKRLEEVAEGYLHDLVGRSLLMVSKKDRYNNRIKTIGIHDVLRDFGTSNAREERFHYHDDLRRKDRRITINNRASLDRLLGFRKPATRTVLIPYPSSESYSFENLGLLRVLDAFKIYLKGDPKKLVHLRFLSIAYADYRLLKSISKLRNIQTLIIHRVGEIKGFIVPLKIWKMPSLRHLILPSECELEQPSQYDILEETSLQTIRSVSNLRLTKKVLEMLMNLKKFKASYDKVSGSGHVYYYHLSNLVNLQKLEKLRISFPGSGVGKISPCFSELAFPESLRKLSVTFIDGSWEYMSVVGSLPNLEVFKLKYFMSCGGWYPSEGQFLKLKHLEFDEVHLDHWEAESVHFPCLEVLVLKSMRGGLTEIPSGIGEIDALKVIQLVHCETSIVDSANQIKADQQDMGNEDLQVLDFEFREDEEQTYHDDEDYEEEIMVQLYCSE